MAHGTTYETVQNCEYDEWQHEEHDEQYGRVHLLPVLFDGQSTHLDVTPSDETGLAVISHVEPRNIHQHTQQPYKGDNSGTFLLHEAKPQWKPDHAEPLNADEDDGQDGRVRHHVLQDRHNVT